MRSERYKSREEEAREGCCASPGNCCSTVCRTAFGGLGAFFVYIYLVSYIFGESGTPQVLWLTGVAVTCCLVAAVLYGIAIACCSCLGDWPLTILACVAAFAIVGGLQMFLDGANPEWPLFFSSS